jgi:hypothetical protein
MILQIEARNDQNLTDKGGGHLGPTSCCKIAIALTDPDFGEQKAQSGAILITPIHALQSDPEWNERLWFGVSYV